MTASGVRVPNLLPGSYKLNVPALPFLHNGDTAQAIDIQSDLSEGTEAVAVNLGSIKAQYYSVNDWLGSSPKLSVLAAVSPGGEAVFAQSSSAASTVVSGMKVKLNQAGSAYTINANKPAAAGATSQAPVAVSLSANANNASIVQLIGTSGDMQIVRISLEDSKGELSLKAPTTTPASAETNSAAANDESANNADATGTNPADETVPQSSGDLYSPNGEPLPSADSASLSEDSDSNSRRLAAGEPLPSSATANIDAAMADVTDGLQRISRSGDRIAEAGMDTVQTFSEAVDRVLTDRSDA